MKMIVLLSILILLTGCAVQDCAFNPQVSIETKSENTQSDSPEEKKDNDPKSIIKDLQTRAQPGGQFTCKY